MTSLQIADPLDRDIAERIAALNSIEAYIEWMRPEFLPDFDKIPAQHHKLFARVIEGLGRGELNRELISVPPGAAKSFYFSVLGPTYLLARDPAHKIMSITASETIAEDFSRRRRQILKSPRWQALSSSELMPDAQSLVFQGTKEGGGIYSFGAGSTIQSIRTDYLLADDLVGGLEEASSIAQLNKLWNWYLAEARPRLRPADKDTMGREVMIACMTGDTSVLMADGTEKPLLDIRPGDIVATHENSRLTASRVLNWRCCGVDSLYKITTRSGKILRANERHPFLVDCAGEKKWIPLKNLQPGMSLVALRGVTVLPTRKPSRGFVSAARTRRTTIGKILVQYATRLGIGANGRVKRVLRMAVKNQPYTKDTAAITTTKSGGHKATAQLLTQRRTSENTALIPAMELPRKILTAFSSGKTAFARYVESLLQSTIPSQFGITNCASIMSMEQNGFGGCSVTSATLRQATLKPWKELLRWRSISAFTADRITAIVPDGQEDVFDVEIERTQNFIANGCVSHNTRWALHDPIGRALQLTADKLETWHYLRIPMICDDPDDPLGRKPGERLWADYWPEQMVIDAQRIPLIWNTLYQQRPAADKFGWVPAECMQVRPDPPQLLSYYIGVDISLGIDGRDYTAMAVIGFDEQKNFWVLHLYRDQEKPGKTAEIFLNLCKQYPPKYCWVEDDNTSIVWREIVQMKAQDILGHQPPLLLSHMKNRDKEVRAAPLNVLFMEMRVFLLNRPWREMAMVELAEFPAGQHDDIVDAMAVVAMETKHLRAPKTKVVEQPKPVIGAIQLKEGKLMTTQNLETLFKLNAGGKRRARI